MMQNFSFLYDAKLEALGAGSWLGLTVDDVGICMGYTGAVCACQKLVCSSQN